MKDLNCTDCQNNACEPCETPCLGCNENYSNFKPVEKAINYLPGYAEGYREGYLKGRNEMYEIMKDMLNISSKVQMAIPNEYLSENSNTSATAIQLLMDKREE